MQQRKEVRRFYNELLGIHARSVGVPYEHGTQAHAGGFLMGNDEAPQAAAPRRAALKEGVATTVLGVAFRPRSNMTIAEAAVDSCRGGVRIGRHRG